MKAIGVDLFSVICCFISSMQLAETMRFVQFERNGQKGLGVELGDTGDIADISATNTSIPASLKTFLEQSGDEALQIAEKAAQRGHQIFRKSEVHLLPPIDRPGKVVGTGLNYKEHCAEIGVPIPEVPVIFSKFSDTVVGPTDDIPYPDVTNQLDWEGELTIVIGKTGKGIPVEKAMDHVFGYTVALDVSARDWQTRNANQVLIAKSMDAFCPIGPVVVTKDELKDPHNLRLTTKVNGVVRQDGNTNEFIFKVDYLVSYVSRFFTLRPGDIILTGTPSGTALSMKPPPFLKPGDVVQVEIEGIGAITNRIV